MACAASARCVASWRPPLESAALRPFTDLRQVDEAPLRALVRPLLKRQELVLAQKQQHMPHTAALQAACLEFNEEMARRCLAAVAERDRRVLDAVRRHGRGGLLALQRLGALQPPWLDVRAAAWPRALDELARTLDETRPSREYNLRSQIVRTETDQTYTAQRKAPRELALREVEHVIRREDVERLRGGAALVLDPQPALLSAAQMREVHADLKRYVKEGGAVASHNPCNRGSSHGMLPVSGAGVNVGPATCELLRKIAALPAIVDSYGWPRPLKVPPMLQLGFFPGGSGAQYKIHLDRQPGEVNNRRELTFLVYCNVDWDTARCGGCLRLHPSKGMAIKEPLDVEPIAGRVVIFESGRQLHEVLPTKMGVDRYALTLWVEYDGEWENLDSRAT
ncbi:hypothetical protein AB1Y20_009426 [Prymnesium parvum]|uniref:Fe2OG dioxygenase domain-containing protein n=1 Tax=Prymnesium parvum TaxID=97485 RepID=A0AB34K1K5_PRYPA